MAWRYQHACLEEKSPMCPEPQ